VRGLRIAALIAVAAGSTAVLAARARAVRPEGDLRLAPVVVTSPLRLAPAVVVGAGKDWYRTSTGPVRYGDPKPVVITAYCLSGTTRRGRYVRQGIVAADPRRFPLSRYIEVYVGTKYMGRYLVDDTGSNIRGARLDIWMPTCREAIRFGRRRGTAVLVPRPEMTVVQAGKPSGR